jgi:pyruvate/2-oxoglutarate dehydrogenase complex dihydrolipoamide acyltransferase (E2) component
VVSVSWAVIDHRQEGIEAVGLPRVAFKENKLIEIKMPKPGEAIEEAIFSSTCINDGESVREGEDLYVVETDKVEMVIHAPATGIVRWSAEVGETYDVGTVLGAIE